MSTGIQSFLDISHSHLAPQDLEIIDNIRGLLKDGISGSAAVTMIPYADGEIFSSMSLHRDNPAEVISAKYAALREEGFSEHFIEIMKYAAANDALLVRFDTDAPVLEQFPTFDTSAYSM